MSDETPTPPEPVEGPEPPAAAPYQQGYPAQPAPAPYGYAPPYGYPPPYAAPGYLQPPPPPGYPPIPDGIDPGFKGKKVAAGICGILLGSYGVHKFILGYKNEGIIMLAITLGGMLIGFIGVLLSMFIIGLPLLVAFIAPSVTQVIGLIEGIMYLTKSDYDFVMTYGVNRKPWF